MNAFQRKIKSLGHKKYLPIRFNDLPEKLSSEELDVLVTKLRLLKHNRSNPEFNDCRDKIIAGHLRLVLSIAGRFSYITKYRAEDLIGEALLKLVEYTGLASRRLKDNNITPYLISSIHSALSTFIENDKPAYMPGRTIRHYLERCSDKINRIPKEVLLIVDYEETIPTEKYIIPQTIESHSDEELLEIIDKLTPNFIEKRVIQLRIEGYSYKEIGPLIGYSTSSISIMVQSIEKRVVEALKSS